MFTIIFPAPDPPFPESDMPLLKAESGMTASGPASPMRASVGLDTMPPEASLGKRKLDTAPPTDLPALVAAPTAELMPLITFWRGCKIPDAHPTNVLNSPRRKLRALVSADLMPSQM